MQGRGQRKTTQRWPIAFAAGVAACLILILLNGWISEFHPGNPWGLSYGISATLLLLGALAYSVRRRTPGKGPVPAQQWLKFHVYGGALFLLLVFMHSGFHFPQGVLARAMWLLSIWIVASGMVGTLIQKWIPRLLTSGLSTEVHYDRIEELVAEIRTRASALAEAAGATVQQFYEGNLASLLAAPEARLIYFMDITGGIQSRVRRLRYLRDLLGPEERERLDELEALALTKLELDAHYTLQRALRWWLYSHVPFSIILVVLVGFHIFTVLYF